MLLLMLLLPNTPQAWAKSPDIEVVAYRIGSSGLSHYEREGVTYLTGISRKRWTVTRLALTELVDDPEAIWAHGFSYRTDRAVGVPDTVIGGYDDIIDLTDPSLPPIAEDADVYAVAHDVDGDGTVDLWASDDLLLERRLFLTSFNGIRRLPLPEDTTESLGAGPSPDRPLLDINLDGFAEIFKATIKEKTSIGFYDATIDASYATVHDGGPDGYTSPQWTVEIDGAILDAVALQADDDPEREVLLLTSDYIGGFGYPDLTQGRTVVIDDAHTTSPTLHTTTGRLDEAGLVTVYGEMLKRLNDLDGDGFDEALLTVAGFSNGQPADYLVLSSAADYDVEHPLAVMTKGFGYNIGSLILDIDNDGHEDLVGVAGPYFGGDGTIRVWFGPLTDPSLTTPHTGDTGVSGDTGAPSHTADTGSPIDDTGTTPAEATGDTGAQSPRAPKEEEPACGCAHSSPAALALLLPLVALRRRPRRQGAS